MPTCVMLLVTILTMLLAAAPAWATILYTFSGVNGLSGSFTLDESTPFVVTVDSNNVLSATLTSPLNHIDGVFGDFTFTGTPFLAIVDQPEFFPDGQEAVGSDHWIIRAPISGPSVNGLSPAFLNLFIFTGPAVDIGASLTPPSPGGSPFDFQYAFAFTDDSFTTAPLTELTKVREPTPLMLLALGGIAAILVLRGRFLPRLICPKNPGAAQKPEGL